MALQDLYNLQGKTALVTGASRGLGQAMALALAEAGCDLAVHARSEEGLRETLQRVEKLGRKAAAVPADVTDDAQIKPMVEAAHQALGRIDILINNAGIWGGGYFVRLKREEWDKVIQTNLSGAFSVAQAAAKFMMKQRSGKIINMASVLGLRGSPQAIAYCAAKAGVISMTRVTAIEMGPVGVQVNAIAPGMFNTDMTKMYIESDSEQLKAYLDRIPSKRYGEPEELGGLAVFLASKAADHITGQIVAIDGGESLV